MAVAEIQARRLGQWNVHVTVSISAFTALAITCAASSR